MQKYAKGNGVSRTPEYTAWINAKNRCLRKNHPRYKDYGARGIVFHKKWINDFESFLAEVGRRPTPEHQLDRINNSKGYVPGNLKWSTRSENIQNRKRVCRHCGKDL